MKINPLDPTIGNRAASQTPSPKGEGKAFQDVLNETVAAESPVEGSKTPVSKVNGPNALAFKTLPETQKRQAQQQLEGLMEGLTGFQNQLAVTQPTPESMEKAVVELNAAYKSLEPYAKDIPKGDALGDLIHQGLITTRVELIKFERGDYND